MAGDTDTELVEREAAETSGELLPAGGTEVPVDDPSQQLVSQIETSLSEDGTNPEDVIREVATGTPTSNKQAAAPETPSVSPKAEADTPTRETENTKADTEMLQSEESYLQENMHSMPGLEAQYVDERTSAVYVRKQIEDFAGRAGLKHDEATELTGRKYDTEAQGLLAERAQAHIDRLFNSDQGTLNPEKHKAVTDETRRYLELVTKAMAEGDLPQDLDAKTVLRIVEHNVWKLAYQDRVATENLLGDHGVRHLVEHNIRVSEELFDQLEGNGQTVKAIDRLLVHQVMIDHDLGYAMDPVRQGVNRGHFSSDRGHNVLAAKYLREDMTHPDSLIGSVFSPDQISIIHEGILHHDSSIVDFRVGDASEEARKDNIYSAIHVADNTHAFENKLPELLYAHSDTLRVMRLMKTASEIGDEESFHKLQADLVRDIQRNDSFSPDDKVSLAQAAHSLAPESYRFTVGRICGNEPTYTIDNQGNLSITVQESAIHEEAVALFGQRSLDQLKKFIGAFTGVDSSAVDLNQDRIVSANGKLEIKVRRRNDAGPVEETDYQHRINELIHDKEFQGFIIGDGLEINGDSQLSRSQNNLQQELAQHDEGSDAYKQITDRIGQIKLERKTNLERYLSKN